MLWKGRTAPDPTPDNPEQLMCLDTEATFDALEVEQPVEQSCCKVRRDGELHLCPHFRPAATSARRRRRRWRRSSSAPMTASST